MSLSKWFKDHPRGLEVGFKFSLWLFRVLDLFFCKIGYKRSNSFVRPSEKLIKGWLFDCRMCGQCILHSTGMTCPMTCPKYIRNGPCGGVRLNGNCEVDPEMMCVWVQAYERSQRMTVYGDELKLIQPPMNYMLKGDAAWITSLSCEDQNVPPGWEVVDSRIYHK